MKKLFILILAITMVFLTAACGKTETKAETAKDSAPAAETQSSVQPSESAQLTAEAAPQLTFIGNNSFKIKTAEGIVVYVDPAWPGDYSEPADIILVSHEHTDHNNISLCTQKETCAVLRDKDNINPDGSYNSYETSDIKIEPVAAYNSYHAKEGTCGFVITIDGIIVYIAGDTSKIDEMADLTARNIDYAFYPIGGFYTMGAAEAMECSEIIGAKHNTPVHKNNADPAKFTPENLLLLGSGDMIELEKG